MSNNDSSIKYIIVKHADPSVSSHYWEEEPTKNKIHISHSVSNTFSGMACDIKLFYMDKEEAKRDCKTINIANPMGYYAVCELDNASIQ